jgi:glucokinase
MTLVLAGDIGGTSARLAIVDDGGTLRIVRQHVYESGKFPGLVPIVREFLAAGREPIAAACMAVAGPVAHGEAVTANLPWVIRARELADAAGAPVELINDFAAVGWGIPRLGPDALRTLQPGQPEPRGPIAYLGAGTGLGEGFMVWGGDRYLVMPSEGGHGDFAAQDDVEWAIQRHIARRHGHVSYERVVSGMGLANIYRALVDELGRPEAPAVREEIEKGDDAAAISRRALEGRDPTCVEALDRFVRVYGAEAGNHAMRVLATGGLYVAGGIAPKILPRLEDGAFLRAFTDKGRYTDFCRRVPVHIIVDTKVGLLGAAACAVTVQQKG